MARVLVILLAVATVCAARRGQTYPPTRSGFLTCHVENPFAGVANEPSTIPELPEELAFTGRRVYNDGLFTAAGMSIDYQVLLPPDIRFRMPRGRAAYRSRDELLDFLGNDFNPILTSVDEPPPERPAPRACDILPAFEGSAGQSRRHVERVTDPINLLEQGEASSIFSQVRADRDALSKDFIFNFEDSEFQTVNTVINETNGLDQLCDIWTGKCPVQTRWVELPTGYFPPYIAQSVCSGKDCSFPRGLRCQEDLTYTVSVVVLRYDCCFNSLNREVLWECGFRKVRVPIFCDCQCGCDIVNMHTPQN